MSIAIKVDDLSKKYLISHQEQMHYSTLRDYLAVKARKVGQRLLHPLCFSQRKRQSLSSHVEEFWALKDVSFEINQGDRVGIIGWNGAGKSTLLKILSRITEPTSGSVGINGRIASLLEVGTGFHPELTGRENIYLNGAILGMSQTHISRHFDEIVDFSEVEKFLDTPIKRYSSGMYVRLAFSVAAHLDPDILIVDEVLAVGDAKFQKKCLEKMNVAGMEGRTILFVSHNMQAITQLCPRAILLSSGQVKIDATASTAIESYLRNNSSAKVGTSIASAIANLPPDPTFKLESVAITQNEKPVEGLVESGKPLTVDILYSVLERTTGLRIYFDLCDDQGLLLFRSFHDEDRDGIPMVEPGQYSSRVDIPANLLGPANYEILIRASIFNVRSCLPNAAIRLPFKVELTGRYNRSYPGDTFRGKLALAFDWVTERRN